MVVTADTDDRVVPGHSFKHAAALQHAQIGGKPHLIRIETRAGHGSGKPTDKIIEEYSDMYAFIARWTGLEIKDVSNSSDLSAGRKPGRGDTLGLYRVTRNGKMGLH